MNAPRGRDDIPGAYRTACNGWTASVDYADDSRQSVWPGAPWRVF